MFSLLLAAIATNSPAIHAAASSGINWTSILSAVVFCSTAMATLIKIFGTSKESDCSKESPVIKEIIEENKNLKKAQEDAAKELKESQEEKSQELREAQEEATKEAYKTREELKEKVNTLIIEIERAKSECVNNTKSIEELKQDYRRLAGRLDELLKQILEWFST